MAGSARETRWLGGASSVWVSDSGSAHAVIRELGGAGPWRSVALGSGGGSHCGWWRTCQRLLRSENRRSPSHSANGAAEAQSGAVTCPRPTAKKALSSSSDAFQIFVPVTGHKAPSWQRPNTKMSSSPGTVIHLSVHVAFEGGGRRGKWPHGGLPGGGSPQAPSYRAQPGPRGSLLLSLHLPRRVHRPGTRRRSSGRP